LAIRFPTRPFVSSFLHVASNGNVSGMNVQAPAIIDVRPADATGSAHLMNWLRGIGVRQVRLACGLVMFSYVFSHFFNHELGNISYATMEAWLAFHIWWRRIPIVNFTLYAAALTHFLLGLWAAALSLYRRGDHPARLRPQHPAAARLTFRYHAARRGDVCPRPADLRVCWSRPRIDVSIRGRDQPLGVCTVADATSLASLLDEQAAEAEAATGAVAHDLA
jgi:hypothetical protein